VSKKQRDRDELVEELGRIHDLLHGTAGRGLDRYQYALMQGAQQALAWTLGSNACQPTGLLTEAPNV
jgi:hypothetical protein